MARAKKPPRIDETKFLPAEAYFAPRFVRSGTVGHQPERQHQINAGVAAIKAQRSERRNERLILSSQPSQEKENLLHNDDNAQEAPAALEREIRQAQSLWLNKSAWGADCDEKTRDDIFALIALQMRGSLSPPDFAAAMREARDAVKGAAPVAGQYLRPYSHPWKIPGGW